MEGLIATNHVYLIPPDPIGNLWALRIPLPYRIINLGGTDDNQRDES